MIAGFFTGALCMAQIEAPKDNASADFVSDCGDSIANVELPAHVVAADGKLTLFADYANPDSQGCVMYLVNRTGKLLSIPTQDGQILLKLVAETSPGVWQRAQSHRFSWCGNSYHSVTLGPGQHFKTFGYHPTTGTRGKIRYRVFSMEDVVSNVGEGFWEPADVLVSGVDPMAASELPEVRPITLITGKRIDQVKGHEWETMEDAVAWLDLVIGWRSTMYLRNQARMVRETIKPMAVTDPEKAANALPRLDAIIALKNPVTTPAAVLRKACAAAISSSGKAKSKGFGDPSGRPWVAWEALAWLAAVEKREKTLRSTDWKDSFSLAEKRIPTANAREKQAIAAIFLIDPLVQENVETSALVAHVNPDCSELSQACIARLASRQAYEILANLGLEAEVPLKLAILKGLSPTAVSGAPEMQRLELRKPYKPEEISFWSDCVKSAPWRSVTAMYEGTGYNDRIHLNSEYELILMDHLDRVLKLAGQGDFPITDRTEMEGLEKYVSIISHDLSPWGMNNLKLAAKLGETAPKKEPEVNAKYRKWLVAWTAAILREEKLIP